MTDKPFSPSCERNRDPILDVLRTYFASCRHVLEIGSGTGQHAVHFAAAMPWLTWQCSDRAENLPGIRQWLDEAGLPNTPDAIKLDVSGVQLLTAGAKTMAPGNFDAVFSANTLHIMSWVEVEAFFDVVGTVFGTIGAAASPSLSINGTLVVYGPFNEDGEYSSDSNREFDGWLRARDPHSGIRDVDAVDALARAVGLQRVGDIPMPANNRCLVWSVDPAPARPFGPITP